MKQLKFFKDNPFAKYPTFATEQSACFDLSACLPPGTEVKIKTPEHEDRIHTIPADLMPNAEPLILEAGERALVPTGLIFDIPEDYKVDLFIRSGSAFKKGLQLANGVGKIDSDYVDPVYILIYNSTNRGVTIEHNERIAQGELVPIWSYELAVATDKPQQKTSRDGGIGSTGTK